MRAVIRRSRSLISVVRQWRAHPLNRCEPFEPFFIVGSGRCGTTLVRRIVMADPSVHIPPETYVLGHVIRLYGRHRHWAWPDLVRLCLADFEYQPAFETFGIPSLRPVAAELDALDPSARSLARLLDTLYRHHARSTGRTQVRRWGDKTPWNTFHMSALRSVFPRAKFVHLIRDGCDVVASMLDNGIYDDPRAAARRWSDAIGAARAFGRKYPAQYLELRYEALVTAPADTVHRLCEFLGIEFQGAMLGSERLAASLGDVPRIDHHAMVSNPVSSERVGAGRSSLPRQLQQAISGILDPQLQELGYPSCET